MPGDDFPDIRVTRSSLEIPGGAAFDLEVVPCGDDPWVGVIVVWPQDIALKTRSLRLELDDCVPEESIMKMNVSGEAIVWSSHESLRRGAGIAIGDAIVADGYEFTIDYEDEGRPEPLACNSERAVLRFVSRAYESRVSIDVETLRRAMKDQGITE
jgi:hypothetical protein